MDPTTAHALLADLARAVASSTDPDQLLADVLPALRSLAGDAATAVLRRTGNSLAIDTHDGAELAAVDLPSEWSAVVLENVVARLVAEEALIDLANRGNNAQQLANMGDYDWHIASDTNRWSDQLYRIYGHEPQSFNASYERFLGHIHPDDRERIQGIHQQAYASGEPYQMIERIVRPDGETRYLSSNGQVIQDEAGAPVRMRGTCIDITDRVLAEQAREQTAARLRGLVESTSEAILVLDKGGAIVQANGHASELLGGNPVGRLLSDVVGATASGLAIAARRLDGHQLSLDVTRATLSDTGDEAHTAVFLRDATSRLESEAMAATLREAQVRRRQALEINDNVVQGLTVAVNAVQQGNAPAAAIYLERTLAAARQMMNDWLDPLTGADLQAGDLVRATPSTLEEATSAPTSPPPPAQAAQAAQAAPSAPLPKVLIVDDYDDVRRLLRVQFERMGGYQVVGEAADGEEAVRLARTLQPHLVLLDLAMPVMDGLQALPLIREAVPGVQVIVLSGFDASMMAQKVLDAGAARYVEKGVRMNLAEILEGLLSTA